DDATVAAAQAPAAESLQTLTGQGDTGPHVALDAVSEPSTGSPPLPDGLATVSGPPPSAPLGATDRFDPVDGPGPPTVPTTEPAPAGGGEGPSPPLPETAPGPVGGGCGADGVPESLAPTDLTASFDRAAGVSREDMREELATVAPGNVEPEAWGT